MKYRNSFISNSSSSSFLICFKSWEFLDKFSQFKSYDKFINDIKALSKKENIKNIKEFIEEMIVNALYAHMDSIILMLCNEHRETYFKGSSWYDFEDKFVQDNESIKYVFDEINKKSIAFYEKYKDVGLDSQYCKEALEFLDDCRNFYNTELETIVKKIVEEMPVSEYYFKCIEYSDDSYGSYMEQKFLPFLQKCPEEDIVIYSISHH